MGVVMLRRPPRTPAPAVPDGTFTVDSPPPVQKAQPQGPLMMLLPLMSGVGSMAFVFMGHGGVITYVAGGLFMMSSASMMFMSIGRQRQQRKQQSAEDRRHYMRYLERARKHVQDNERNQYAHGAWTHPAPQQLWAVAVNTSRLWERRARDADFLHARIGTGRQALSAPLEMPDPTPLEDIEPVAATALRRFLATHRSLPDLPIAVDLTQFSAISVSGDVAERRGLARALVAQLVTFHANDALTVIVCAGRDAWPSWEWVKWLPHCQHPGRLDDLGPLRLLVQDAEELESVLPEDLTSRPLFGTDDADNAVDVAHLVVVLDGVRLAESSSLVGDPPKGVTLLDLDPDLHAEPVRTELRIAVRDGELAVDQPSGPATFRGTADSLSVLEAESLARHLAPYRLSDFDQSGDLERNKLELTDLLEVGDAGELDTDVIWQRRPPRSRLRLPIGLDEQGQKLVLDLKESAQEGMGPHGLLIGATGSGKSELLRTLVMGLVMTHSPEILNLVLVDFKGGATFAGMTELPHVSAVITNLSDDLTLIDRMQDAITGEMVRRQELLKAGGNFVSLRDYEAAREAGRDLEPLPSLVVICDEFSELLSAQPDFIDLFVAIGRLGRSLGVHLLLASQRLEEGKLRGLDSHLSYRIGLRTFSSSESRAVLGVPDAYELPSIPGVGYLQADTQNMQRFKAAYVSAPYDKPAPEETDLRPGELRPLEFLARQVGSAVDVAADEDDEEDTDNPAAALAKTIMDVAVERMVGKGVPAHQIWLPPLAEPPSMTRLLGTLEQSADLGLRATEYAHAGTLRVPLGIVDKPYEQRRDPLIVDVSGASGHTVVVGGPQAGKSTVLRSLITSFALTHTPQQVQFYCIDLGGGTLSSLAGLPHVGGVGTRLDEDTLRRNLAECHGILLDREKRFTALGIDSMATFRSRRAEGQDVGEDAWGDVFLVLDGLMAFRSDFEELEDQIQDIALRGLGFGVHLVLTASRWGEIRPQLRDPLGTRLELRLGDPAESEFDRRRAKNVPEKSPGRGIVPTGQQFLAAVPRIDGNDTSDGLLGAVAEMVGAVAEAWHGEPALAVRMLPDELSFDELPAIEDWPAWSVPIGIDEARLEPVYADFIASPHMLLIGDSGSGKTGVLRLLATAIMSRWSAEEAQILLVDYRRSLLGVVPEDYLLAYCSAAGATQERMQELAGLTDERLPGDDITAEQLRDRSWWQGPEVFVLVDDYDLVATQSGNPLLPIAEYLPQGRDIGLHVVLTRRSSGASRSMYEPVITSVNELSDAGFLLSGDKQEGPLIGSTKPQQLPPGRAQRVSRGAGVQRMQFGWVPPPESGGSGTTGGARRSASAATGGTAAAGSDGRPVDTAPNQPRTARESAGSPAN